ncbi:TolC family protein [Algoriphagus sp.]|uniref:TolC family protein n=1 Tax=Algoriphagus sp. TaxID=1872435 RepID=UPI003F71FDC9
MLKLVLSALFGLTLAAHSVQGQQKSYTLGELWLEVEKNYPGIQAKQSAIQSAEFNQKAVKSKALPEANIQFQNTYGTFEGNNGGFFPQPGFFNVSGNPALSQGSSSAANTFGSATLEFEVFSFGRQKAENHAAKTLTTQVYTEKEGYLIQLKKELTQRFVAVLYADSKLGWAEKNATRLKDIYQTAAGLSKSGLSPSADSLLAHATYLQALAGRDYWQGSTNSSIQKLEELHGIQEIDFTNAVVKFLRLGPDSAAGYRQIDSAHPFIEYFTLKSDYYKLQSSVLKKNALPSLKLLGGYAYRGTGIGANGYVSGNWEDGFSNSTNNLLIGAGVTWNITSLLTNKLKADVMLMDSERSIHRQKQQVQAMVKDLSAARSFLTEQKKQLTKTLQAVKQAGEAYEMYMARYRSGLISLTELLQIQVYLQQAEADHVDASRDYWLQVAGEAELTADFGFLFDNL